MVRNEAFSILSQLVNNRRNKKSTSKKLFEKTKERLWKQAEELVDNAVNVPEPAAEQAQGATITHRPDIAYGERSGENLAGQYRLNLSTEDREYLGRKLSDDRKEGVAAADRILAGLNFADT